MKPAASNSRSADDRPDDIAQSAANWLAQREAGFSVEAQAEFSRWLLADARHAEAVQQLEADWRFLKKARATEQAEELWRGVEFRVAQKVRARRRWLTASFGGLAAAAAFAVVLFTQQPAGLTRSEPAVASIVARPEKQTLPDGTVVEFNAGAEIGINFTPEQRNVTLVRGEAHFAVTKNPARPFVVTAGAVRVRAVGTAFNVRFEPEHVGVLVTEGRVAVERTVSPVANSTPVAIPAGASASVQGSPEATPIFIDAGNQLNVPTTNAVVIAESAPTPSALNAVEMDAVLAWRSRRVEFTNTPLVEALAVFNRQNQLQITLGDAGLAAIRISGIYWSNDPEGFTRLIADSAGLHAVPASSTAILLHR